MEYVRMAENICKRNQFRFTPEAGSTLQRLFTKEKKKITGKPETYLSELLKYHIITHTMNRIDIQGVDFTDSYRLIEASDIPQTL